MSHLSLHTPIGDLTLFEEDDQIMVLDWGWSPMQAETPLLTEAKKQLDAYFDGDLKLFDLPLKPKGTAFQKRVWAAMCNIPYGEMLRYGEVAKKLSSGARPVGTACGKNPIPIIIPCHRIIASAGMGGYGGEGGLETKRALLALEGAIDVPLFYNN